MISLKIIDIKAFMSSLLVQTVFDNFLLSELHINTFNHFQIAGNLNEEYYSSEEREVLEGRKYSTWSEIKPIAYSLIKGNKLPLSIKIVLLLSPSNTEKVLTKSGAPFQTADINGLFLNIRFDKGNLYLITGTSVKSFSMDKTLERAWDDDLKVFLKHYEIAVEEE
ncbi:DUF5721 family protein [Anaerocolumna sp. AGMB13025]|uniref:DUF5721 family protein n=1 Tax=Anaerocolumna sp. AGMB13025 TaxID=3039116 RepID=UPI00241F76B0|nr:DUF5721 family protein [Anaerocolumna sp. AGMB13025]WFR59568.1 DUF5721 family protein [Anaerocolumna sp. AGMB13025]